MDKVTVAKSRLMLKQPFFGALVMKTPIVEVTNDSRVPRAATDMRKIYYDTAFFKSLSVDEIAFVLAHEVGHIALKHGFRRKSRVHRLWNEACDYVINWLLKKAKFQLLDDVLISPKFAEWYEEQVYEHLVDNPPPEPQGNGSSDACGSDVMAPGDMGDEAMSPTEQAIAEAQIDQNVRQATQIAKMAGNMPGDLERALNVTLQPKVPWLEELREHMTRVVQDEDNWKKRNRRYQDVYLPGRHSYGMGPLGSIVDTSMSIDNDELDAAGSEIQDIAVTARPESIRVLWADTEVAREQVFQIGEELDLKAAGGGGTDMRVPLEYMAQYDPAVVVLFTDGHTPWPEVDPPYPLIVCCSTDVDVPIGHVIRIN